MATYTVTGHPLNITDLDLSDSETTLLHDALQLTGVGASLTITLSGPSDTEVKDSDVLE